MRQDPEETRVDLIERTVTLLVSEDTLALWEALAARLELDSFDALCQALCLYGAFLLASADMGYLEGIEVRDLSPEAMRAVFVPWLRKHVTPPTAPDQESRP